MKHNTDSSSQRLVTHSVNFRRQNGPSVYGLNLERPTGSTSPWTADNAVLESLVFLFEECTRYATPFLGFYFTDPFQTGLRTRLKKFRS